MTRSGYIKSNSVRLVSIYRHTPPVFRPQKLTVPHTVHNTATSPGRFGSTATCEQRKKHSVMGSVYPPGSHEAAVLASSNQGPEAEQFGGYSFRGYRAMRGSREAVSGTKSTCSGWPHNNSL